MPDLLTNTRLREARACLRRHRFMFRDGWRPRRDGVALRFGTLLHRMLECHARGQEIRVCANDLELDPVDLVKAEELVHGYIRKWGPYQDVLGVEVPFECPLPSPDLLSDHPWFRLAGKIDVVLGPADGATILDHKTTSESLLPEAPLWTRLALDTQISQYMIGAEALGFQPARWVHDVIRKPEIEPLLATPVEKRKYTKDGRLYAAQRAEGETLDEYRLRLRDDIASRPDWYFARKEVVRLESQILAHIKDLWAWAPLLDADARNPDSCTRFGVCPFFACCASGTEPADHLDLYRKVEVLHPELEPENQPCH